MPLRPAIDVLSDLMEAREPLGRIADKELKAKMLLAELGGRAHQAGIQTSMEGDHTLVLTVPDAPKVFVAFSPKDATWAAWSSEARKTIVNLRWSRGESMWTGVGRWTDRDGADHYELAVRVLAKEIETLVGPR